MPGPLNGVEIVDVTQVMYGPFATMILADQGAEVVKIESPGIGDVSRQPSFFERGGLTAAFANHNRNKRGMAVDITRPEGLKIVHQLVADADVFVQNWRPGVAERNKLGEADLRKINPNLIYCSLSGYGPTGPYADRRAYDPIIQCLTGLPAAQKNPDFPMPDLVRNSVVDKGSAVYAAQAITAALFARDRGAGGQHVQVPMIDASLAFFWPDAMMRQTFIGGDELPGVTPTDVYHLWHTKDGQIVYMVASQKEHEGLFRALGHPEWKDDARFKTAKARTDSENRAALGGLVEEAIRSMTTEELLHRMIDNDIPVARVLELDEVLEDPQIVHNGCVLEFEHPTAGRYRQAGPVARFDVTPQEPRRHMPPLLGEHTEEILGEYGYAAEELEDLRRKGVIPSRPGQDSL